MRYTKMKTNSASAVLGDTLMLYCAQPHKEICRFAAASSAILTAGFIGREYILLHISVNFLMLDAFANFLTPLSLITTSVGACIILYFFASSFCSSASITS